MTSDTATILRARHRRLTKTWQPNGTCEGYDAAKHFDLYTMPVDDLDALEVLLVDLAQRWDCGIVRGGIVDSNRVSNVRRLVHPDPETGEAPTLLETPHHWLALDIDGVPLPDDVDRLDLAVCASVVLPLLPTTIGEADLLVQATSGHAIKPGARLRLWGWCDRPLSGAELTRWFQGAPVDMSLFRPAQIHYTARPLFAPGVTDPLRVRMVRLKGRAALIQAPLPEALAPPPKPTPPPQRLTTANGSRYALAALTRAVSNIARQSEGTRHPTAVAEAWGLARLVRGGLLTDSEVARAIDGALRQAGKPEGEGAKIAAWACKQRNDTGNLPEGIR